MYKNVLDLYIMFLIQLRDFPITIILTVSPKLMSKPFSPIKPTRTLKPVDKSYTSPRGDKKS